MCIWMFIGLTITQMSINWQMNKLWYLHTMEYASSVNRNKPLIHATTLMDLKSCMLRERKKPGMKIYMLSDSISMTSRKRQNFAHEQQSDQWLLGTGVEGRRRNTAGAEKNLFGQMKIFCILILVMVVI